MKSCISILFFITTLSWLSIAKATDQHLNIGQDSDDYDISDNYGVSIASGFGAARIVPLRIGIQKAFCKQWKTHNGWPVTGYVEGSFYALNGKRGCLPNGSKSNRQLYATALALAFRINAANQTCIGWPYLELGVGGSYLTRKEIGGRELGMHFQFEDRIGLGLRLGEYRQFDLAYRAVHFSNAYLGHKNHGINLHMLVFGYWF